MPSGALKVLALFAPEELEALEALEELEPFELALVPVFELPREVGVKTLLASALDMGLVQAFKR